MPMSRSWRQVRTNQPVLNLIMRTPIQSVADMLAKVWFNDNGETAEK